MLKYDWKALFTEYILRQWNENDLASLSVDEFLRTKWMISTSRVKENWWITKKVSWRQDKKKAILDNAHNIAIKEIEKKLAKNYKPDIETLSKLHKKSISFVAWVMNEMFIETEDKNWKKKIKVNPEYKSIAKDLETIRKMIKIEKWEPTTITKNENINSDIEQVDMNEIEEATK